MSVTSAPPYSTALALQPTTHPLSGVSLGYLPVPAMKERPLKALAQHWLRAGLQRKPVGHVLTNSHKKIFF